MPIKRKKERNEIFQITCKRWIFFIFYIATAFEKGKNKSRGNMERTETAGRRTSVSPFPQACGVGTDSI